MTDPFAGSRRSGPTFAPTSVAEHDVAKRAACAGRCPADALHAYQMAQPNYCPHMDIGSDCICRQSGGVQPIHCRRPWMQRYIPDAATVLFTPDQAAALVATSTVSGRPEESKVQAFAAAMRAGLWRADVGDLIVIRGDRLEDGRHRLAAVILLGRPQELSVKFLAPTIGEKRFQELAAAGAGYVIDPAYSTRH